MKNDWKLLWNPFSRIAGWQAFAIGLVIFVITTAVGKYANLAFDGAIDAHGGGDAFTMTQAFLLAGISLLSVVVVMYLLAFALTRQFRFIDILGTMTFARFPFFIMAIAAFYTKFPSTDEIINNPLSIMSNISLIIFGIISIPVGIWVIALMYNAFKVSTGAKGPKLIAIFITGLILAEIISKVFIHYIYPLKLL